MISPELLREVFGYDVIIMEENTSLNPLGNVVVYRQNNTRGKIGSINIHELAHKCKEWALDEGYEIFQDAYMIGAVLDNNLAHEIQDCDVYNYSPKGVFMICEWVREQKATHG